MDLEQQSAAEFNDVVASQTTAQVELSTPPIFLTLGREITQKLSEIAGGSIPKYIGRYKWKAVKDTDKERVIKAFSELTPSKQAEIIQQIQQEKSLNEKESIDLSNGDADFVAGTASDATSSTSSSSSVTPAHSKENQLPAQSQ